MASSRTQEEMLANIRRYATENHQLQDEQMDVDSSDTEARLEKTVRDLQARVQEQQAALEKLRAKSKVDLEKAAYASQDPREKLQQLLAVKTAYKKLTPVAPYLPEKGSVLPALLAARTLLQTVSGTKEAVIVAQGQIKNAKSRLHREEANLQDAHALTEAMENRIERLRSQQVDRSRKTPAELARDLIAAKQTQQQAYDYEVHRLTQALDDFLNNHLAAMIAAEELGGPVVGDMLDPGEDDLAAGFTKAGKTKSVKKLPSETTRQKTIDQIWGVKTAAGEEGAIMTEAEAAHEDMGRLIEDLLNTLTGPGGGKAYHRLEKDSATSRFLVRAKVAQFHPKDARRLRLIDFGRDLDD